MPEEDFINLLPWIRHGKLTNFKGCVGEGWTRSREQPQRAAQPRLNKLIIEVEMKILEKDMAISSYFRPKFIRTNLLKFE